MWELDILLNNSWFRAYHGFGAAMSLMLIPDIPEWLDRAPWGLTWEVQSWYITKSVIRCPMGLDLGCANLINYKVGEIQRPMGPHTRSAKLENFKVGNPKPHGAWYGKGEIWKLRSRESDAPWGLILEVRNQIVSRSEIQRPMGPQFEVRNWEITRSEIPSPMGPHTVSAIWKNTRSEIWSPMGPDTGCAKLQNLQNLKT